MVGITNLVLKLFWILCRQYYFLENIYRFFLEWYNKNGFLKQTLPIPTTCRLIWFGIFKRFFFIQNRLCVFFVLEVEKAVGRYKFFLKRYVANITAVCRTVAISKKMNWGDCNSSDSQSNAFSKSSVIWMESNKLIERLTPVFRCSHYSL